MKQSNPILAAAILAALPATSYSQDVPNATNAGIEEVLVTSQRREQTLQEVGLAVNVLTGASMVERGVTTVDQMSAQVPALQVGGGGGANSTFFVRGVGNFTVNGYSDPAVAFNYDDVYLARPTSAKNMFFDIARVEVLKGPQGTLYGRNATAGAINVIPVRPSTDDVAGYISASLGDYSSKNIQGAVNVPVGDSSAIRLSGLFSKHDPYLSDGTSDEDIQALRLQFLSNITDQLSVRIAGDYSEAGGAGVGASYAGSYHYNFQEGHYDYTPSGIEADKGLYDPESQAYRQHQFLGQAGRTPDELNEKSYMDNNYYGINAEIIYRMDFGTFTLIPAYRKSELDNQFSTPGFGAPIREIDTQSSVELRFASEEIGIFEFVAGANHFDETVDGNYTFGSQVLSAYQDFTSDTKSSAIFVDVTAHVMDDFRIVGGLRYTKDKKAMNGLADVLVVLCNNDTMYGPSCPDATLLPVTDSPSQLSNPPFIVPTVPGPYGATPIGESGAILLLAKTPNNDSLDQSEVTWRAGIEYDLDDDVLIYSNFSTGYRSGGFSLAYGYETFEPEYLDAYVLGMKSRMLENRLQLNVEAFYWKYTNQQIAHDGVDARGNPGFFVENAGKSTNKGIELETVFALTENTRLNATVQYLDATYDEFAFTQPINGPYPPLTACATQISGEVYSVDCSGKSAFQSPEWVGNLGIDQHFPMGDYEWIARLDTQYKDQRVIGFEYLQHEIADSFWRTNLNVSFGPIEGDWKVTGWIQNLEDERQPNTAPLNTSMSVGTVVYEAPRIFGIRYDQRF
jgi:iron complex outermembrane recepter protein